MEQVAESMPNPETRTHRTRLWVEILLLCAVVVAGIWFAVQFRAIVRDSPFTDFGAMYDAGRAIAHGQSPYDLSMIRGRPFAAIYKFPPMFAIVLAPFTWLEFHQLVLIWLAISLAFYLTSFLLLARVSCSSLRSVPTYLLAISFLVFQPALDTLYGGQLEFLILLLLTISYVAFQSDNGKVAMGGVSIALAALLKIYPTLLLTDLVVRRVWRGVAASVLAVIAVTLFCGLAAGWNLQSQFYFDVLPRLSAGTASLENQSFFGFFARFFVDGATTDPWTPTALPIAALLSDLAAVVSTAVSVVALFRSRQAEFSFAILVPLMLLAAPTAWIHYETILLLPMAILLPAFLRRRQWQALVILIGAFMLLAYGNEENISGSSSVLLQSYKFFGVLLVWLLGIARVLVWSPDRKEVCGSSHQQGKLPSLP